MNPLKLSTLPLTLSLIGLLGASCTGSEDHGGNSGGGSTDSGASEHATEAGPAGTAHAPKVLHLPMRSGGPGSLDPLGGSTVYDNRACSMVYEGLLQYKYLKRPYELEPLLLAKMPETSDNLTYSFELKSGVLFHDDACFEGGIGRELVTEDVFYSLKRVGDNAFGGKNLWLLKDTILGYDEFLAEQNGAASESGGAFDYDAPVKGFNKIDEHRFEITLSRPVSRFLWLMPMFQLSVVPREAVEKYGKTFARHPVGTGPFLMKEGAWEVNKRMTFTRNPKYREAYYPTEWMPEDEALGLHEAAGKRIPFVDRVEMTMFVVENPMWLEFKAGKLDYTQVPAENYLESFHKRSRALKKEFKQQGVVAHAVPLLDFIFRGFNMEHPILGGYGEKNIKLRKAISYAIDLNEFNNTFYNGTNVIFDGMIPPGIAGYPKDGKGPVSYRGLDLEKARTLLAEAGYPGGEGLGVIDYYSTNSGNIPEQAEMLKRQLGKIGIKLNVRSQNFAELIDSINLKKAPMYTFAWSTDYPDAENNLALFYGPNEAPGSNHYNYKSAEFDKLYEQIQVMENSPERTKIMVQMRDLVMRDVPYVGSMARTRFYLVNPWLKNFKPEETFYNWVKYMDLDESARK